MINIKKIPNSYIFFLHKYFKIHDKIQGVLVASVAHESNQKMLTIAWGC